MFLISLVPVLYDCTIAAKVSRSQRTSKAWRQKWLVRVWACCTSYWHCSHMYIQLQLHCKECNRTHDGPMVFNVHVLRSRVDFLRQILSVPGFPNRHLVDLCLKQPSLDLAIIQSFNRQQEVFHRLWKLHISFQPPSNLPESSHRVETPASSVGPGAPSSSPPCSFACT